jgi:hypothetical protein
MITLETFNPEKENDYLKGIIKFSNELINLRYWMLNEIKFFKKKNIFFFLFFIFLLLLLFILIIIYYLLCVILFFIFILYCIYILGS